MTELTNAVKGEEPSPLAAEPSGGWARSFTAVLASRALAPVLAAAMLVIAGLWWRDQAPAAPFAAPAISRLTNNGNASRAAVSPDGKYVAYVQHDSRREPSVWIRQIAASAAVQIVEPADRTYVGLTFSRDGNFIYYLVREEPNPPRGVLYRVPALGGHSEKILTRISSPVSFSPDGGQFAYLRVPQASPGSLLVANADGSGVRIVTTRDGLVFESAPAWSPDGQVIVCAVKAAGGGGSRLVALRVDDGRETDVTTREWRQIRRIAWLADGRSLLINASEQVGLGQIWHVTYSTGAARRVTNDASADYEGVSLSDDARTIAAVERDATAAIWVADDGALDRARQITRGKYDGRYGVRWSPDGRIVYASMASGNDDIWIMNRDGTGQRQLTVNTGADDLPEVSPDARRVVFSSDRNGPFDLWQMDVTGANQTQLTTGMAARVHQFTADGKFVIFSGRGARLWKVPVAGGEPRLLTERITYAPALSPDGTLLAAYSRVDSQSPPTLVLVSADNGEPARVFNTAGALFNGGDVRWTPDGRSVMFLRQGQLWTQPRDRDDADPVNHVESRNILKFDWSEDGALVFARGDTDSDVVLIR